MNPTTPGPADAGPRPDDPRRPVRFRLPDRSALLDPRTLDQLLPQGHPARLLWILVDGLDLSDLLAPYKARLGRPGKPPIDVRVLATLWLFATHEGIDSARRLAELCLRHDAYRWIAGGLAVSYHTLSDFRVGHGDWLRGRCLAVVAALRHDGLVRLDHVGQDGLRLRASAGGDSMKTAATLAEHLAQAQARLASLEAQDRADGPARAGRKRTRKQAAVLRGARDRHARLRAALDQAGPLAQAREARKKGDGATTRVSETDPECRRMKMADGGFRPAFNAQFATDLDALVVVGAHTTNAGNDAGQLGAMQRQLRADYAVQLEAYYADGGYATAQDIEASADEGVTLYAPIKSEQKRLDRGEDPYARKQGESDAVAAWRQRMGTAEGKAQYKGRGKTEWSNAQARRGGLYQVRVRGLAKVDTVVLWVVLLLALLRGAALRRAAAGSAGGAGQQAAPPEPERAAGPIRLPAVTETG